MKLNYKRTICVGFAFFLICAFWQAYDNTIPLILTNKFGMSQAWSGVIMALDNILALFLLPLFGAISDKHTGRRGRRTPFIVFGTIVAAIAFISLSLVDDAQLKNIDAAAAIDDPAALRVVYQQEADRTLKTPDGETFVLEDTFTEDELKTLTEGSEKIRDLEDQIQPLQEQYAALQPAGDGENGGMNDSVPAFPAFTGKDLDGNDVDNSIFSQNAVTVVNFWFSGCKPCVAELGELNALNETLKKQGGAVVGINVDTLDGNADAISTAKNLLESKGASYQNIYFPSDSAAGDFAGDIMAFPTTYVIDRSGAIVGEAMLGGIDNEDNMAELQKLIDQALANNSAK